MKHYVTSLLIILGRLNLFLNAKDVRPFPWLMQNVGRIVEKRKKDNVNKFNGDSVYCSVFKDIVKFRFGKKIIYN